MFFSRPTGHKFVDRGDPSALDFNMTNLTTDGSYYDLDLSAIIPKNTKLVMLRVETQTMEYYPTISVRKNGNIETINIDSLHVKTLMEDYHKTFWVAPDADGVIEYNASGATYSYLNISVGGWFVQ